MAPAKIKPRAKPTAESRCPLTAEPRLRLASDEQTDSIRGNFPRGISRPALRALYAAGLTDLQQLTRVTERELSALHGMGPKAMMALQAALKVKGLKFRT